jgi:outer membrane protein assembly factor BamB
MLRLTLWSSLLAAAVPGLCGEVGKLVASKEPGWPQFRGPRRDGVCDEKGLLQSWPEGGPKLLWTASGMGRGYSSPIITRGSIYITGDFGKELHVLALDMEGKLKWRAPNGSSWTRNYPGSRSSCTYDEGRLYHMNAHGRVACFDPATGSEAWAVNVCERFEGQPICWGLAEAVLVDGPRVIATPGGKKALMVALDKKTGATVWAAEPLMFDRTQKFGGGDLPQPVRAADQAGYASPVLFGLGGRRHIVGCSSRHAFGVDADTGKLLWTFPMPTTWEVLASVPTLYKDCVFVTGPDGQGGKLLRLRVEGQSVRAEEVWTAEMDTCQGGVIAIGDVLYGSWYRHYSGMGCVDALTGKTLYRTNEVVKGSMVYADGRLYYLSEQGVMALLKPTPAGFEFVGRFNLTERGRGDVWPHPVILDGRLYLRYHDKLSCYDVKAK